MLYGLVILTLWFTGSCRKKFQYEPARGRFRTNVDTLFLDSVFTHTSSPTYSFKIYNTSHENISIPFVGLENGSSSFYRLNVDGMAGRTFRNVEIPAGDSIFVFVEVTADISRLPDPVYEENLIIGGDGAEKKVLLTAFVKDALFLYPERYNRHQTDSITVATDGNGNPIRVSGFLLDSDTTITDAKAVVIYGHLGIPRGVTLHISEGAHLYFHYNSGIVVYEGGRLDIEGSHTRPVILEDDRMQPEYEKAPGMWNFIWFQQGSSGNRIRHTIIKNTLAGIIAHPADSLAVPVVELENTRIYNAQAFGIFAAASYVTGDNVVINNCGSSALRIHLGGRYRFRHCTFANYGPGIRGPEDAAVYISNYYDTYDNTGRPVRLVNDLEDCLIANSIIYGNRNTEWMVARDDNAACAYFVQNSLIRFDDPMNQIQEDFTDFANPQHYADILLNGRPDFHIPEENDLHIGMQSDAIGLADPAVAASVPLDLDGNDRTAHPDAGAYQHRDFDDN
ncbi:MAG: hypothetical protein GXO24_04555 [Chlorobi bacterium]|nr:hypothetical protein [Chlorobiota bacterium]